MTKSSGHIRVGLSGWLYPGWRGAPLREPRDVFVYFDNDAKVHAPADAQSLRHKLSLTSPIA